MKKAILTGVCCPSPISSSVTDASFTTASKSCIEEFKRTATYLKKDLDRTEGGATAFGRTISSEFDYLTKDRVEELITDLGTKRSELSNLKRELTKYMRR